MRWFSCGHVRLLPTIQSADAVTYERSSCGACLTRCSRREPWPAARAAPFSLRDPPLLLGTPSHVHPRALVFSSVVLRRAVYRTEQKNSFCASGCGCLLSSRGERDPHRPEFERLHHRARTRSRCALEALRRSCRGRSSALRAHRGAQVLLRASRASRSCCGEGSCPSGAPPPPGRRRDPRGEPRGPRGGRARKVGARRRARRDACARD